MINKSSDSEVELEDKGALLKDDNPKERKKSPKTDLIQSFKNSVKKSGMEFRSNPIKFCIVGVRDQFQKDTVVGATFNFVNSIIGAGILFIPFLLKTCGIIFGVIFIVMGAVVMSISLEILFQALNKSRDMGKKCATMEEMAKSNFGWFFYIIVKITFIIFCCGCLICYFCVLVQLSLEAFFGFWPGVPLFHPKENILGNLLFGSLICVFLYFMSLSNKIRGLRVISFVSITADLVFFILAAILYFSGYTQHFSSGDIVYVPDMTDYNTYLHLFSKMGIITFSYILVTLCPVHSEYGKTNTHKVEMAFINSQIICCFAYLSVGFVGYFSFFDSTEDNIISSYSGRGWVPNILRLLIFLELFLTFPVYNYRTACTVDDILMECHNFLRKKKVYSVSLKACKCYDCLPPWMKANLDISKEIEFEEIESENDIDQGSESPSENSEKGKRSLKVEKTQKIIKWIRHAIITWVLVFCAFLVAAIYPESQSWLNYSGSSSGVLIALVFPCLIHLKVCWKDDSWFKKVLIILFGVVTTFFLGVIPFVLQILEDLKVWGEVSEVDPIVP